MIDGWAISCEIALIWLSLDLNDEKSTLVQVMAWCRPATSHYLSQCWPRSLMSLGHNELSQVTAVHFDALMQKKHNSSASAMELRLFCIKPSIWRSLVDEINGYPIIKWVAMTWQEWEGTRILVYKMATKQHALLIFVWLWIAVTFHLTLWLSGLIYQNFEDVIFRMVAFDWRCFKFLYMIIIISHQWFW